MRAVSPIWDSNHHIYFFFSCLCISSSELSSRSTHIFPILVRQMWDTCCYLPFSSLLVCLPLEFQFGVSGAILYLIEKFSTSHHTIKGGMNKRSLFFVWLQILIFDAVSFSSTLFFQNQWKSYYASALGGEGCCSLWNWITIYDNLTGRLTNDGCRFLCCCPCEFRSAAPFGSVSVESFVNTWVTSDCILNQDWDFYRICCNPILFGTVGAVWTLPLQWCRIILYIFQVDVMAGAQPNLHLQEWYVWALTCILYRRCQ